MTQNPDVSFVFPCLNEEQTIVACITELKDVLAKVNFSYEIIVSDNGSVDRSIELAREAGARVVHAPKKGYGEALKNGFEAAKGKYVAFADVDGSYPLSFLPALYKTIKEHDADMVIASRMLGKIEKGAMPFLHRFLGTPVLTFLINALFGGNLSDCNSGFRIFKKEAYQTWHVKSSGMEFASELLIKALKAKANILEIPAGLRPDKRTQRPHLKTWRDGMRHLLFILSEAPLFFESIGLGAFLLFSLLQGVSSFCGQIRIFNMNILGFHSQLLFVLGALLGLQSWLFSMFLYVAKSEKSPVKLTNIFLNVKEQNLFWGFLSVLLALLSGFIFLFLRWKEVHYSGLNQITFMINFLFITLVLGSGSFGLLCIHTLKRTIEENK